MKLKIYKILLGASALCTAIAACSDDKDYFEPIETVVITSVTDFNVNITKASMGDFIAIHGKGMDKKNIDSILIDDVRVDLGETYSENDVLYLKIPVQLPQNRTDRIYIHNRSGIFEFPFHVDAPDLKLYRMFNEYTQPGDTLTIYGDFFDLYEIAPDQAVVDFGGKEMPVISSGNNYLTAEVPEDVQKDIRVKVKSEKYGVEAQCPGKYYDRRNILVDYDEFPSTNTTYVITDPADEERLSGNFMRVDENAVWSGWWYISESWPVGFTDDMLDHPEDYEIKCEFRSDYVLSADKLTVHCYLFWDAAPIDWTAGSLAVQNTGRWETIKLPFVVNRSATYTDNSYYKSFNLRIDAAQGYPLHFAFDNFRIVPKGD